jgi:hypothetical protein
VVLFVLFDNLQQFDSITHPMQTLLHSHQMGMAAVQQAFKKDTNHLDYRQLVCSPKSFVFLFFFFVFPVYVFFPAI